MARALPSQQKDDGAVLHHGDVVGALHSLPAGDPAKAGDVPGQVFFPRAHVDEVHRALCACRPLVLQPANVEKSDAVLLREAVSVGLGCAQGLVGRLWHVDAVRAAFELVTGQRPAGGAVGQREHVGNAHALQHARADDASRAARAVDDDGGVRLQALGDVRDAQGKLSPGNAAPAGYGKALVLLRRARVEDDRGMPLLQPGVEVVSADVGDVVLDFDALAEVLAGHVHAPLRRAAPR